jgi:hypothetical protein
VNWLLVARHLTAPGSCVNVRAGYPLADEPAIRPGHVPASGELSQSNQPFQEDHMKKLVAALIAASFAFTGAAFAAEAKKEEKKPTAEQCKKDPKMKGCEAAKPAEAKK